MGFVRDALSIYRAHAITTEVITASIRHPLHVIEAAKAGSQVATVPSSVLSLMMKHPLTDIGLARFFNDWKNMSAT